MIRSGFITIAGLVIAACAAPQVERHRAQPPVPLPQKAIGGATAGAPAFDDVAWDKFQHRTIIIWSCRRALSGEIIPDSLCHGKSKNDLQWRGMAVPASYKGLMLE